MWTLPSKLLGAVSDATIGTAIVMVHIVLLARERERRLLAPGDRGQVSWHRSDSNPARGHPRRASSG